MDISFIIATFIASAIAYSVSLLFGTLGELLTERAGNVNLGVEGMMLLGGACGYVAAVKSDNLIVAIVAASLGAAGGALLYAVLTVTLRANQNVSGLALTTFGAGLANTLGSTAANTNTPQHITDFFSWHPFELAQAGNPFLKFINVAFLSHDVIVYISIIIAVLLYFFLFKTKEGLSIRMVGENPAAADAAGISVTRIKYIYILLGGILCGLGGLYIPLVLQKTWHADITAGKGWIVVALVIFVRWHPLKAIAGALVFGALSIVGLTIQQFPALSSIFIFNQYIMVMYPYILTVIVLVITYARRKAWRGPNAIGVAYFREER